MPYTPIPIIFIFLYPVLQNYQKKILRPLLLKVLKGAVSKNTLLVSFVISAMGYKCLGVFFPHSFANAFIFR